MKILIKNNNLTVPTRTLVIVCHSGLSKVYGTNDRSILTKVKSVFF